MARSSALYVREQVYTTNLKWCGSPVNLEALHCFAARRFSPARIISNVLKMRCLVVLLLAGLGFSQSLDHELSSSHTILIFPFENNSRAPGLEWIGESFPELMGQRMASLTLYPLPRENRVLAYERMGIPSDLHPSKATLYRVAEQLDVDYAILGTYGFDGRTFTAVAQLL